MMILPTEDDARILDDVATRVLNIRGGPGIHVTNSPTGITISAIQRPVVSIPQQATATETGFHVRIASSEAVTDQPNHYVYTGYRQIPYTPGLWQDDPDNTDAVTPIYNTCEANNSASGKQGNGVDLGDYPDGTEIPPLQGNPVLWCRPGVDCYGDPEYWVSEANAAPFICEGS
jgi:hypothetical protein